MKTLVSFCKPESDVLARKSIVLSKRCTRKNMYMRSIKSSGVGNCLFLRARGWGIDHQERKNCKSSWGVPSGGMITGQIEPYIST